MLILLSVLLVLTLVVAVLINRDRHRIGARLAEAQRDRDDALATAAGKWLPMEPRELSRLAKTGHKPCGGAGMVPVKGGQHRVCDCVLKRMAGNPRYGMSGNVPVRLATAAEMGDA